MSFTIIYVTHKNMEEAKKIVQVLLEQKYIACANFFPMSSMYLWKGEVVQNDEIVTLLKTTTENWEILVDVIEKLHPYDIPWVVTLSADANFIFEKWLRDSTIDPTERLKRVGLY